MILLVQEWYKMSLSAQILATVPEKIIEAPNLDDEINFSASKMESFFSFVLITFV